MIIDAGADNFSVWPGDKINFGVNVLRFGKEPTNANLRFTVKNSDGSVFAQKDIDVTECINCGQKNRIKQSDNIESVAKCGKCKFELNASYEQKFILSINYFGLIIFQIIMIINLLPYKN